MVSIDIRTRLDADPVLAVPTIPAASQTPAALQHRERDR